MAGKEGPLSAAASAVVERARIAVEDERRKEADEIAWAASQKEPLAAGYWQARHAAELRLRTAEAVRAALAVED